MQPIFTSLRVCHWNVFGGELGVHSAFSAVESNCKWLKEELQVFEKAKTRDCRHQDFLSIYKAYITLQNWRNLILGKLKECTPRSPGCHETRTSTSLDKQLVPGFKFLFLFIVGGGQNLGYPPASQNFWSQQYLGLGEQLRYVREKVNCLWLAQSFLT